MVNITIEPVHSSKTVGVIPESVFELRIAQHQHTSFHKAWHKFRVFRETGFSQSQALCLWELVRLGEKSWNSDWETMIRLRLSCRIQRGGKAWIEFNGKDLRFTPKDRWLIGLSDRPSYQYLHLAVRAIHRL